MQAGRGLEPRLERENDTNAALGNLAIYALAGRYAPPPPGRPSGQAYTITCRNNGRSGAARCDYDRAQRHAVRGDYRHCSGALCKHPPSASCTAAAASCHRHHRQHALGRAVLARSPQSHSTPAAGDPDKNRARDSARQIKPFLRCRPRGAADRAYCCLAPRAAYSLINCSACLRRWRCGGRGPAAVGVMPLFAGIAL